jgi:hypothetical protein
MNTWMFETWRRQYNWIKTLMKKSVHFVGSYYIISQDRTWTFHFKMWFHTVSYWIGRTIWKPVGVIGQLYHFLLRRLSLQSGRYLPVFRHNIFSLRLSLEMDVLSFSETPVNFCLTTGHRSSLRHPTWSASWETPIPPVWNIPMQ